jgi:hypothetical protein
MHSSGPSGEVRLTWSLRCNYSEPIPKNLKTTKSKTSTDDARGWTQRNRRDLESKSTTQLFNTLALVRDSSQNAPSNNPALRGSSGPCGGSCAPSPASFTGMAAARSAVLDINSEINRNRNRIISIDIIRSYLLSFGGIERQLVHQEIRRCNAPQPSSSSSIPSSSSSSIPSSSSITVVQQR